MNFVEVSGFANLNIGFGPRPNLNPSQDSALDLNPKQVLDSDLRPNPEDSVNSKYNLWFSYAKLVSR